MTLCDANESGSHPYNCSLFYLCDSKGDPHLFSCPAGLHYSGTRHCCDWPENAKCSIQGTEPQDQNSFGNNIADKNEKTTTLIVTNGHQSLLEDSENIGYKGLKLKKREYVEKQIPSDSVIGEVHTADENTTKETIETTTEDVDSVVITSNNSSSHEILSSSEEEYITNMVDLFFKKELYDRVNNTYEYGIHLGYEEYNENLTSAEIISETNEEEEVTTLNTENL